MMAHLSEVLNRVRGGVSSNSYSNETAVRTQIVLPILQRLGWDIFDPATVRNEVTLKPTARRVDIALCALGNKPRCIIELKATKYALQEVGRSDAERQLFEYLFRLGASIALLTNGVSWRFYSTYGAGPPEERLVRALDIRTDSLDEVGEALERYLSHENTASGRTADYPREDLRARLERRDARKDIPRAWTQLLEPQVDNQLVDLLAAKSESLAARQPARQDVIDFLRRLAPGESPPAPVSGPSPSRPAGRRSTVQSTVPPRDPSPPRPRERQSAKGVLRYHL